jgi:CubicO group peptidase (beta-lactamase class C family)
MARILLVNSPVVSHPTTVQGDVEPGWGAVADAFLANFDPAKSGSGASGRTTDVGAACCVYSEGRPVVDVWAGVADPTARRPWDHDTLQLVFSTTKGATAVCAHLLAQRGELDLDAPIAAVWPEFAANGKAEIPLRWVLSHRSGLAAIDGDLTLAEVLAWDPVVEALAAQATNWEPDTAHGYHVRSYGWLVGEVVRRITGRSLGRYFADEVAAPLGLDFWIGLPEDEEVRVAAVVPPHPDIRGLMAAFYPPDTLAGRAMTGPSDLFAYDEMWNSRAVHAAEMPSSNGITSARALARMYAATVGTIHGGVGDGVRLLDDATIADATRVLSDGPDLITGMPMRIGTGFMLAPTLGPSAPPRAFGHSGAGGSLGLADPDGGLGFGYVMNRMVLGDVDLRADSIVAAAVEVAG